MTHADYQKRLEDIFYKANFEHLIQDEPNYGFCETCQEMADWKCHRANNYLSQAKQALTALCRDVCGEAKPEIAAHPNGPVTLADCQRGLDHYESNMLAILGQPQEETREPCGICGDKGHTEIACPN